MRAAHYPIAFAFLLAGPAAAGFACQGAPGWTLTFDDVQARFAFPAPTEMEVVLQTPAQGADWPRAYTLVGTRDTAIVLIEAETCGASPWRAHVLTQRAEAPILLTGCCQEVP